jgi:biotin carboxyl carrier protein
MKYFLSAIVILISMASCTADKKVQEIPVKKDPDLLVLSQQQLKGVNVEFTKFSERQIRPLIHANGIIKLLPESKAEVSSHIAGKVDKIFVREGMRVTKGQALIQITSFEALELQNEYVAALSDAEFQAVEYKRQEELMQKRFFDRLNKKWTDRLANMKPGEKRTALARMYERTFKNGLPTPEAKNFLLNDFFPRSIDAEFINSNPSKDQLAQRSMHPEKMFEVWWWNRLKLPGSFSPYDFESY